ncbi:MAG: TIGR02285 family protein [Thalassolituus sp.]|uniref:TIGR02285 family protein n=2 Tax=Thalassolituus sp. TaxID=2030822 RepID=UPI0039819B01
MFRNRIIIRMLALVSLSFPLIGHADEKENILPTSITWVKNDAPPFYITQGHCKSGFGDQIQSIIERNLPEYRHQTFQVPLSRLEYTWAEYSPLCFATMIYQTPINDQYILSHPNAMYMPHGIITTNKFADSLPIGADGTVSLEEIIRGKKVSLGHIAGRSYANKVDNLLAKYSDNVILNTRSGSTETQGVLNMLSQGRFDILIEYEFVLNHYIDEGDYPNQLRFIPIKETRGEYILGAIGCTNSPEGKLAINSINTALDDVLHSRSYRRAVADWLVPVGDEVNYWTAFDKALKESLGKSN